MNASTAPIIFGSGLLLMGVLSYWGRFKWARLRAKASVAANPGGSYDKAYRRWLRYSSVSGLIYLSVGGVFFLSGVIGLLMSAG
jgi:hypothetical protein